MGLLALINNCIESQTEPKRIEMEELHRIIRSLMPGCNSWILVYFFM
jgi:hypothetical protein